jgi:hypothetical protein
MVHALRETVLRKIPHLAFLPRSMSAPSSRMISFRRRRWLEKRRRKGGGRNRVEKVGEDW